VRDNFNLNLAALAVEQVPDVGVLDIPDAGFIIVSSFDYGDAHFPIPWPEPATSHKRRRAALAAGGLPPALKPRRCKDMDGRDKPGDDA
jgi:hypothetical protein